MEMVMILWYFKDYSIGMICGLGAGEESEK